jgi:hypothetical protein
LLNYRYALLRGTVVLALVCSCGRNSDDCRDALEVVCSCESIDCADDTSVDAVLQLRECIRADEPAPNGLAPCVEESGNRYCAVADGLAVEDGQVCEVSCAVRDACDLAAVCTDYQYHRCDIGQSR